MAKPFRGVVNLDIRDSVPDWGPYEQPKAPPGSANVLYIVLDDVGFGALGCYGGPIETPNIDKIAANGLRFSQWHTTALCSPTRTSARVAHSGGMCPFAPGKPTAASLMQAIPLVV